MKKRPPDTSGYKTEDMLKEEARQRMAEQALLNAQKPPASALQKKRENFWYHYKWHTVAGVFAAFLIGFFLKDTLFRVQPDVTVVVATGWSVPQETLDALQAALEETAWDFNGDGKVEIQLDSIYLPPGAAEGELQMGGQQDYASAMKLSAVLAAGAEPLYLVDDHLYDYLKNMAQATETDETGAPESTGEEIYSVFQRLDVPGADDNRLPVSETSLADLPGLEAIGDMTFALRPLTDGKTAEYHRYCHDLLAALAK